MLPLVAAAFGRCFPRQNLCKSICTKKMTSFLHRALADDACEERSVCLGAGDRLYVYSDGISEAMDPAGKQFGKARLLAAIGKGRSDPLPKSVATIREEVARWPGSERPQDDISILAVGFPILSGVG